MGLSRFFDTGKLDAHSSPAVSSEQGLNTPLQLASRAARVFRLLFMWTRRKMPPQHWLAWPVNGLPDIGRCGNHVEKRGIKLAIVTV